MPVIILPMHEDDIDAVAKVHSEQFPRQKDSVKWIGCNFAAFPRILIYVARDEKDKIVGYIQWIQKSGFRQQSVMELEQIAVIKSNQGKGIGGIDVINPYLAFIKPLKTNDIKMFRKQCDAYQAALTEEILGFMARSGISTVSAYKSKNFNLYGIDKKLAAMLGLESTFGGIDLKQIARMTVVWHKRPKPEGMGKYNLQNRKGIWAPENTLATIKSARNEGSWTDAEKIINTSRNTTPRDWLELKPSEVWNRKNLMRVLVLGCGAAALNVTGRLLAELPVTIDIIEKNVVNPLGLVGNGVAPDHPGTKKQGQHLREVFENPLVKYYGGVEVGKDVSMQELESKYACIIDCCGASKNRMLDVPGESLPSVVSADEVYKAYNNTFNPLLDPERDWRFFPNSKNDEMIIIGNGNVAADVTRILLNQDLEETSINPKFLIALNVQAPTVIHVVGIETPDKTRISLNQLQNLAAKDVWMTAHFDCHIDVNNLNETEKKLYHFFLGIKNNTPQKKYGKQIHFYFNYRIKSFSQKTDEIEAIFTDTEGKQLDIRAKSCIKAIGVEPDTAKDNTLRRKTYQCGWRSGQGGTLAAARESAEQTVKTIKQDFHQGKFNYPGLVNKTQGWEVKSSVSNQEQLNILDYLGEGHLINTPEDFIKARQYRPVSKTETVVENVSNLETEIKKSDIKQTEPVANPEVVTLINSKTGEKRTFEPGTKSLLAAMKESGKSPSVACGGELICGDCKTTVVKPPKNISPASKKEIDLHKIYKTNETNTIFACAKPLNKLVGGVFEDPASIQKHNKL